MSSAGVWYQHPNYAEILDGFIRASTESPVLRDAIERDVDEFFQ